MKQLGLGGHGFAKGRKTTRRERFLHEMDAVVPWAHLVVLIAPHYPTQGRRGRPPMPLETMLCIHFMQLWFSYSGPAMEEALHDMPLLRRFAGLSVGEDAIPDETTILNFRHLLERHQLAVQMLDEVNALLKAKGLLLQRGTTVDATLIAAPPLTKSRERKRDPEMSSTKKGSQWYFGMKCHIGADSASELVHTVVGTAAKVADVRVVDDLLHGEETKVFGDKAYTTRERNLSSSDQAKGPIWCYPYKRPKGGELPEWKQEINRHLASLRARVEHPFRVVKQQLGFTKVRYGWLMKNTAHLTTLFALANPYTARRPLLAATG